MAAMTQVNFRIPVTLRDWLNAEKAKNRSSITSELVRCIQERKERVEKEKAA